MELKTGGGLYQHKQWICVSRYC